jgi:hypothetical protein
MLISTDSGRLKPEMRSPADRATMVFYSSVWYRFDVISAFPIADNGRKTISASRGRVGPEVIILPFDSLTPIRYGSALEFFLCHPSKVIRLFLFASKMPFENFVEGIFPRKIVHR